MGLIQKIFGGIFGFIASLFGSIAKVFGLGKSEFFMELTDDNQATVTTPETTSEVSNAAEPATAVTKPGESKPASKTMKPEAIAQAQAGASTSVGPSRPLVSPRSQEALAAAAEAQDGIKNFATDFLVNPKLNRSPRRRPGPSISPFKEMAKSMGSKAASMG